MSSDMSPDRSWTPTIERFSGYAEAYDRYRPRPPAALLDVLCDLAGTAAPERVVDLGCGPGTSTRVWAERAGEVIGMDPAPDMLRVARQHEAAGVVTYRQALAHDTSLPDACADIVTCGMSLHWMDPEPSCREILRILRPRGTFGAFSYHWLVSDLDVQRAYGDLMRRVGELEAARREQETIKRWPRRAQEEAIEASGAFRLTRPVGLHHVQYLAAGELVEMIKTYGVVRDRLKEGHTEEEVGLDAFARTVAERFGGRTQRVYFSWSLFLAAR